MSKASPKGKGRTPVVIIAIAMDQGGSDRSRCNARLLVSSMRLTPSGLARYFVPDKMLFIKPHGQIVIGQLMIGS